jgi:phytoene dehydrogenase-like protein
LIKQALEGDDFNTAERAAQAALAAARRTRDVQRINEAIALRKRIESTQAAYRESLAAVSQLASDPDDPDASLAVGSYYCFAKRRWEDGLAMLARGSDARLAEVATQELRQPTSADEKLAVADYWWVLAQQNAKFRSAMQARAAHWYTEALAQLPAGVQKIKAEVRIREAASVE